MSKERLEEIKQIRNNMEEYMNPDGSVEDYPRYDELALFIIDDYLDYLIEQAERVQELESKLHHEELLKGIIENRSKTLNRYREALEFYADRDNYKLEHFDPNLDDYMSTVDYDEGKTARNALEGEE